MLFHIHQALQPTTDAGVLAQGKCLYTVVHTGDGVTFDTDQSALSGVAKSRLRGLAIVILSSRWFSSTVSWNLGYTSGDVLGSMLLIGGTEYRCRREYVLSSSAEHENYSSDREVCNMLSKRKIFSFGMVIFIAVLGKGALWADQQKNKDKPEKSNSEKSMAKHDPGVDTNLSVMVSAGISIGDARKLASRFELTGSKPLPPGIRKNLARGKPMPPGIQKTRMPTAFIDQLPHHKGYEWQQAGTDLVLVVSGNLVISDVLEGVFD